VVPANSEHDCPRRIGYLKPAVLTTNATMARERLATAAVAACLVAAVPSLPALLIKVKKEKTSY
jgi:hypothetical protein